jgi:hypothetical protein
VGGGEAPPPPPGGGAPPRPARPGPEIPPVPLAERLKRAGKTAASAEERRWSSALGSNDPTKVAERLKKLEDLEKAEAERQQATMSEIQRAQAERDAEKARADQLAEQLRDATETAAYQRQDQQLRELASEHVSTPAVRFARHEWASYVASLPDDEQEKLTSRDAKKWFKQFAVDNPQFAKSAAPPDVGGAPPPPPPPAAPARGGAPRRPAPPPGVVRRPATTGAPPAKKDPAAGAQNPGNDSSVDGGKTARPGQRNSMSPAEVREFAAKHGVKYPG